MCAAGSSSAAASRQTIGFYAPQQLPVKSKPPCFGLDLNHIAPGDAYQLGDSSALADDFFSGAPVTQSGQWMDDSGVGVNNNNAFGTSIAGYNSLDNSFCYDSSFDNLDFSQSDGIMGQLPQLPVNVSGTDYPNQSESPSITLHSPSHRSLHTTSHDNSPQNFISPDSQDNIPSGSSPRASVSPDSHSNSNSSKTGNPSSRIEKRTRNTIAARRYRQKRVDQVSSLESALKQSEDEKDALKVRVARLEGELEALRGLVKSRA
ncbi:hypothetical protein LHYA1_G001090 [Lachnellula hyalina]|uniref:BZIP domain-containing protein n=1 Tax=Lachnellula hyalina TaxID=1316788 RepID=A0A8H8U3C0_9HELO|nr:uncharacterized protein LHYA1_G001090 [Lachnellula hyalina]TVY30132.1 hypothetical protein LHYA1_G001090 [Lachnellula hyalina]